MKYIRTKEGYILEKDNVVHNISKAYGIKDIKEADTIHELIDKYVIVSKTTGIGYITDYTAKQEGFEIYGAIWTDKGLIYVAKLNDKGELELL